MDPSTLPRAIALQFDTGEIVYPAGGQPVTLWSPLAEW